MASTCGNHIAHGGFLGVLVAMWWFGRRTQRTFWQVTDFIAPLVPTGLAAGRMGNFINGELPGRAADAATWPWAMWFPQVDATPLVVVLLAQEASAIVEAAASRAA